MRWLRGVMPTGRSAMRWDWMRSSHPAAAQVLDAMSNDKSVADHDYARILSAVDQAAARSSVADALTQELIRKGPGAALHPSGLRALPGEPVAKHNLLTGQVRLGGIVDTDGPGSTGARELNVDLDTLRTSFLAVGPASSGKTRGIAAPLVEHLSMTALTHGASLVVIDPHAQFDNEGWFDVTIDPLNPSHGISLFGGAPPDVAADRLASALLPRRTGDGSAFVDAASNALHGCLTPYVQAFGEWPTVRELLALLRADRPMADAVRERLKGPDASLCGDLLDARRSQVEGQDPAASLIERVARLDRPAFHRIFDAETTFDMGEINGPVRVRVVPPEADYPDAARVLARVVASQFVQVASAARSNRQLFKALVVDGAAGCVDDYVATGLRRLRASNAGVALFTRALVDFDPDVRASMDSAVGSRAVFGGVDSTDAGTFAHWLADDGGAADRVEPDLPDDGGSHNELEEKPRVVGPLGARKPKKPRATAARSEATRPDRARWTSADISGIPRGHCVMALTRSNGFRSGPALVDLRN